MIKKVDVKLRMKFETQYEPTILAGVVQGRGTTITVYARCPYCKKLIDSDFLTVVNPTFRFEEAESKIKSRIIERNTACRLCKRKISRGV